MKTNSSTQSFDFIYDDDDENENNQYYYDDGTSFSSVETGPRVTVEIGSDFQHRAVMNDLEAVRTSLWPLSISIQSIGSDTLEFNIAETVAHFHLLFNSKYPLEAPKMMYLGPRYDFCTLIQLSIDFKKFRHKEWSIRESLVSILDDVFHLLLNKTPEMVATENDKDLSLWTEDEKVCLDFLKEIDCFQNSSFFEESHTNPITMGKGTGYGSDNNVGEAGGRLQKKKKGVRELFSTSCSLITATTSSSPLLEVLDIMDVLGVLTSYVQKNTYLNIAELREYLGTWVRRFPDAIALRAAVEHKTRVKEFLPTLSTGPNIILIDNDNYNAELNKFVSTHHFRNQVATDISNNIKSLYSRILLEIMDLDQLSREESSLFRLVWCPTGPFQLLRLLLYSSNDPYLGGMFEFHVYFPLEYPHVPPSVQFMTTAGGTVRFNPNLYTCGKVCLSLLGTWSGEPWNPSVNNMMHVVLALSVMIFTNQPLQNEPAYSSMVYFDPCSSVETESETSKELLMVHKYKFQLRYMTLQHAILAPLVNTDSIFYPAVWALFQKNQKTILHQLDRVLHQARDEKSFTPLYQAKCFQTQVSVVDHHYASNYENMLDRVKKLVEDS
jgi:baculoviral IAP repeat-containing protein 6